VPSSFFPSRSLDQTRSQDKEVKKTHHYHGPSRQGAADGPTYALAQGLGWFSIGLGLVELLAPRSVARHLGMEERTALIQAFGARELATGVAILTQHDPKPWILGRVGGDMLDIVTLVRGFHDDNPRRGNVGLALIAVLGVTVLDVLCGQALNSGEQWDLRPPPDYSDRRGMPQPIEAMRGAARDLEPPADMRIPEALRPYPTE
jgi:hypothetical protein